MHKPSNTLQQVKEWLEKCSRFPFETMKKWDALYYIQQLETRLAQVERERDAAVNELKNSCMSCQFVGKEFDDSPCEDCFQRNGKYPWSPMVRTKFEWRGVCAENTEEGGNG